MIVKNLRPSKRPPQKCPICGEMQDNIIPGTKDHPSDKEKMLIDLEHGYSFCNCNNIFFTDWSNMKQVKYDQVYTDKYTHPGIDAAIHNYFIYHKIIRQFVETGSMLELGCLNPTLLNEFKSKGWTTSALDIIPHKFEGHENITADFDKFETDKKYDLIWASHVFEHFKDPIGAAKKCHSLLSKGGMLFVSMPDPYFIDYHHIHRWGHWHLEEHHIMWDLESFCGTLVEIGFDIIMAKHNVDAGFICNGDQHIIARKK